MDEHGKEWFVAKDVAEVLGYTNPHKAIRDHCKGVNESFIPSTGGVQATKIIPRADVLRLIMKSKLPAAEAFEKWVFEEVLPSIQKTGAYLTPQATMNLLQDPKTLMVLLTNHLKEQEERI